MIPSEFNQDAAAQRRNMQRLNEATKFTPGQKVQMIGSLAQQMKREGLAIHGKILTVRKLQGNTHLKVRWSDGGDRGVLGSNVKVVKEGLHERAQLVHSDWKTGEVFYKLASADEREQFEDQARFIKGATFKKANWPGKQNVYVFAIKGKGVDDTSELLRKRMFPSLWRGPLPKDNVKVEGVNEEYITEKVSIVAADNKTGEVILNVLPGVEVVKKEMTAEIERIVKKIMKVIKTKAPGGSEIAWEQMPGRPRSDRRFWSVKLGGVKDPGEVAKWLRKNLEGLF